MLYPAIEPTRNTMRKAPTNPSDLGFLASCSKKRWSRSINDPSCSSAIQLAEAVLPGVPAAPAGDLGLVLTYLLPTGRSIQLSGWASDAPSLSQCDILYRSVTALRQRGGRARWPGLP